MSRTPTRGARGSADRFAARSRQRRGSRVRGALAAVLALAVLGGLGWVVLVSPLVGVRRIDVVGAGGPQAPVTGVTVAAVRAATGVAEGTPLLRVDASRIAARVSAALPGVGTVQVHRLWPGTLRVVVTERAPAAVLPAGPGAPVRLVDAAGVAYAQVAQPPAGLPVLALPGAPPAPGTLRAALDVLAALPPPLRAQVATVRADTPDSVSFDLPGGVRVVWGGPGDGARKAAVLAALLRQPARVYDVSAPDLPVTRS